MNWIPVFTGMTVEKNLRRARQDKQSLRSGELKVKRGNKPKSLSSTGSPRRYTPRDDVIEGNSFWKHPQKKN